MLGDSEGKEEVLVKAEQAMPPYNLEAHHAQPDTVGLGENPASARRRQAATSEHDSSEGKLTTEPDVRTPFRTVR